MANNSNPFLNPELLNPKLAADLSDAFEKNKAKGLVKTSLGSLAVSNLADIVKEDSKIIIEQQNTHNGLDFYNDEAGEYLDNPEKMQCTFEAAFTDAENLFRRICLTPPTPEQFTNSGVDFLYLATMYERMEIAELEPAVVINPTLRLDNTVNITTYWPNWQELYNKLFGDSTIQNNPLVKICNSGGLNLSDMIMANSGYLFKQELNLVTKNENIHNVTEPDNNLTWTIALVPTTNEPQELGTPHTNHESKTDPNSSEHITISQYLTLQANRIQSGQEPVVSKYAYTWLQGTFEEGSLAPDVSWDSRGWVSVHWDEVDNADDHNEDHCVCLPVWG